MKSSLPILAAASLMLLGTGPALSDNIAPSAGAPHQACPFTDRLHSWKDVDSSTAIVEMGVNHRYKVKFVGECREMRYAIFAKVVSRPGICLSAGDRIAFTPRHGIASECVVQSVEALPPPAPLTPASAPAN